MPSPLPLPERLWTEETYLSGHGLVGYIVWGLKEQGSELSKPQRSGPETHLQRTSNRAWSTMIATDKVKHILSTWEPRPRLRRLI